MKFNDIFTDNAKGIIENKYKHRKSLNGLLGKTDTYHSNNWRKLHGIPMKRKGNRKIRMKIIANAFKAEFQNEIEKASNSPIKMRMNIISSGSMEIPLC